MRAAIYARYSTDQQNPRSIDDQVRDAREYCARKGWIVAATFSDAEISGGTVILRPGMQALMAAAVTGQFDIVLVEALNRFARNLGDTAKLREQLLHHQVALHTVATGEVTLMHVAFDGLRSEMFVDDLRVSIRRGQRGNIAEGLSAGGLPYGYEVVKEIGADGELKRGLRRIREDQAAVLRRIFAELAAGLSAYKIVARLNAEGVPAPGGGKWSVNTINGHRERKIGILHNEIYIGVLIHGRVTMTKNPSTGKRISRANPESAWRRAQVEHLRIVDDATWAAAHDNRRRHSVEVRGTKGARQQYLLSGLVTCTVCGGNYTARDKKQLVCAGYLTKGTCTNAARVKREQLEDQVLGEVARALPAPEVVSHNAKRLHDHLAAAEAGKRRAQRGLVKELGDVRGKIGRLVGAIAEGQGAAPAAAMRLVAELEAREAQLEQEIAAGDSGGVVTLQPNAHEIFMGQVSNLRAELTRDAPAKARAMGILRGLIDRVEITPKVNGGYTWKVVGKLAEFLRLAAGTPSNCTGGHSTKVHPPEAARNAVATTGGFLVVAEERPVHIPPARLELKITG